MTSAEYMGRVTAALLSEPVIASVAWYPERTFIAVRWVAYAVARDWRGGVRQTFGYSCAREHVELASSLVLSPERDVAEAVRALREQIERDRVALEAEGA